jgi:hypothetical protein
MAQHHAPSLFLFAIGIDEVNLNIFFLYDHAQLNYLQQYRSPDIRNLQGCVNDAGLIADYFQKECGVPIRRTFSLKNKDATKKQILLDFRQELIANEEIAFNDPIVFFYAGHGTKFSVSGDGGAKNCQVEAICPYDHKVGTPGIPDFILHALFQQLVKKKGNNIVRKPFLII